VLYSHAVTKISLFDDIVDPSVETEQLKCKLANAQAELAQERAALKEARAAICARDDEIAVLKRNISAVYVRFACAKCSRLTLAASCLKAHGPQGD